MGGMIMIMIMMMIVDPFQFLSESTNTLSHTHAYTHAHTHFLSTHSHRRRQTTRKWIHTSHAPCWSSPHTPRSPPPSHAGPAWGEGEWQHHNRYSLTPYQLLPCCRTSWPGWRAARLSYRAQTRTYKVCGYSRLHVRVYAHVCAHDCVCVCACVCIRKLPLLSMVLLRCYRGVTVVSQKYYSGATVVLQWCYTVVLVWHAASQARVDVDEVRHLLLVPRICVVCVYVTTVWQQCDNSGTTAWQQCDNIATTL
jgi:hypothetical protein